MDKLIFVLTNNGSDIRTTKEIQTLSHKFDIIYLGIGDSNNPAPISKLCYKYILIGGKRNSLFNILKFTCTFLWLLVTQKISTIHLVNENTLIYFYPFLFFKHVILDLYDSLFLRFNIQDKYLFLKRFVYWPANKIIVTDNNRYHLMYNRIKDRCTVIPNVPNKFYFKSKRKETMPDTITIAFVGALSINRGAKILIDLCELYPNEIHVIMAGWLNDKYAEKLITYPNVNYKGVLLQEEINEIIFSECDYIFSLYAPTNQNNINASPNKLYDSIHTQTPIIINQEIKISEFVKQNNIGYIIDSFYNINYTKLFENLNNNKDNYVFSESLIDQNSWDIYEDQLINIHCKSFK